MKLVAFPNTPQKQVFVVTGASATFGSSSDNAICVQLPEVSEYQGSLTFQEGAWTFESLDEKTFSCGGQEAPSLKLKVGLKFALAGVPFLVLDVTKVEEEAAAAAPAAGPAAGSGIPGAQVPMVQGGGAVSVIPPGGQQGYQMVMGGQQWMPAMGGQYQNPWDQFVVQTSDTMAKLGLIFAVLGPVLLGVGEILGLVLSLLSLSRRRNTARGNIMAWTGVVVSLLWFIGIGLGVWYFATRDAQKHNEIRVVQRLEKAVVAEFVAKYSVAIDDNGDMVGEYVTLERFKEVPGADAKVRELSESPQRDGYNYYAENVGADSFTLLAIPQIYGVTGRNTYWVNEYGYVVGEDRKGGRFDVDPLTTVENLAEKETIQSRYMKEIADKLLWAAEQAFHGKKAELCQRILENLREGFPYSPAANRLTAMEKENAPFLIEAKALRLYADVKNYLENNQGDPALATMRKLVEEYPEASIAIEVRDKLNEVALALARTELEKARGYMASNYWNAVDETLNKLVERYPEAMNQADLRLQVENCRKLSHDKRDQFASNLLKTAERLELEGDSLEAYNTYLRLKDNYSDTAAAKGVEAALKRLSGLLDEKTAAGYIAEIMRNVALSNETVVVNMINLLKNGCGNTREYHRAEEQLERIRRDCVVKLLRKEAEGYMAEKNYRAALDRIEQIIVEMPEMMITMKAEYENCLAQCFELSYAKGTFDEALDFYERYISLSPENNVIAQEKVDRCHFKRGQHLYQYGNLAQAVVHLEKCSASYVNNPDFSYLCGSVNASLGRWESAVRDLLRCNDLEENYQFDMRAVRSYAIWKLTAQLDARVVGAICKQADFIKTIKEYKLMRVRYVKAAATNTLSNANNVQLKVDRTSITGDILVTLERDDADTMADYSMTTGDNTFFRDLIIKAAGQFKELSVKLDEYNKTSKNSDKLGKTPGIISLKNALQEIYDMMKVVDERERMQNENILALMNQDLVYHKQLGTDVGKILKLHSLPLLRPQYKIVGDKYLKMQDTKKALVDFYKGRNRRYKEVQEMMQRALHDLNNDAMTVDAAKSFSETLTDIYNAKEEEPLNFVKSVATMLQINLDLSQLEKYLPKIVDPKAEMERVQEAKEKEKKFEEEQAAREKEQQK